MDMWQPYICVFEWNLHGAKQETCFDKYHVAKHLVDAVDKVRRGEQRKLVGEGDRSFVDTKERLGNPETLRPRRSASSSGCDASRFGRRGPGRSRNTRCA